jgi:hypothetical protein
VLAVLAVLALVAFFWIRAAPIESGRGASADLAPTAADIEVVAVGVDSRVCAKDRPLRVELRNRARATLQTATIGIEIFEEGRSENLVGGHDGRYKLDFILGPDEPLVICVRMPQLIRGSIRDAMFRGTVVAATFYKPGEFIPRRSVSSVATAP